MLSCFPSLRLERLHLAGDQKGFYGHRPTFSVLRRFSPVWVRMARGRSTYKVWEDWISSRNARPDAFLASRWGCGVLGVGVGGVAVAYEDFELDHACISLELQSSRHARMVDGCFLLYVKLHKTLRQEGHMSFQSPRPLLHCRDARGIFLLLLFRSLSRHCVMIMYPVMSFFSNYLSSCRDSRLVRYKLKMVQRNELRSVLCTANHFL